MRINYKATCLCLCLDKVVFSVTRLNTAGNKNGNNLCKPRRARIKAEMGTLASQMRVPCITEINSPHFRRLCGSSNSLGTGSLCLLEQLGIQSYMFISFNHCLFFQPETGLQLGLCDPLHLLLEAMRLRALFRILMLEMSRGYSSVRYLPMCGQLTVS